MKQTDEHQDHFVQGTNAAPDLRSSSLRIVITGDDPISISIPVVMVERPQASVTQDLRDPVKAPRLTFLPPDHPLITTLSMDDSGNYIVAPEQPTMEPTILSALAPSTPVSSRRNPSPIRRWRFAVIALSICFLLTLITLAVLSNNLVVLAVIWTSVLAHPKIHAS